MSSVFKNKRAIILGGTSGIGLAAAQRLIAAGAEVHIASRRGATDTSMNAASCRSVDVLQRAELEDYFADIGEVDYLVNAATGGPRATGPFLEMDLDGFQGSFAKLWGYTNSVRLGAPHVRESGAIALVSGYPARRPKPGYIAISTVGSAVEGFVRSVAAELAPKRINVVSPGIIDTPMFAQQGQERAAFLQQSTRKHLLPRAGTADEVARGILFVLENEFVTGTTVDVDGGALLS